MQDMLAVLRLVQVNLLPLHQCCLLLLPPRGLRQKAEDICSADMRTFLYSSGFKA